MRRVASSARGNVATDARLCPGSVAAFVLRLDWLPVVEDHHDLIRGRMYQTPNSSIGLSNGSDAIARYPLP